MKKFETDNNFSIALIGAGWIGGAYAHAFRNLHYHTLKPNLYAVATTNAKSAKVAANNLGFANRLQAH